MPQMGRDGPSISEFFYLSKVARNDLLARPGGSRIALYRWRTMARPPKDDDATQNLKPEDKTQRAKKGTKIGKLRRGEVMADFKKIVRGKS